MKRLLMLFSVLMHTTLFAQTGGGVGIGTTSPDSNAILELKSTNKALLLPRLANSALTGLTGKAGMIAYDADRHEFAGFVGADAPITTNINSVNSGPMFSHVTQTYTSPRTFGLKGIGIGLAFGGGPVSTASITLYIFSGTGISGTELGSNTITIALHSSGIRYFDLSAANIQFQDGQIYTLMISSSVSAVSFLYTNDTYSGGSLGWGGVNNHPDRDLVFEIHAFPGQWTALATAASLADNLSGYVKTTGDQTISGSKAFSGDLTTTGLLLPSAGGTSSVLDHYEEATFPVSFSNGLNNYATNYTMKAVRVGKQVTLTFPADLIDLNISGVQVVRVHPIPLRFIPPSSLYLPIPIRSNGGNALGIIHVSSSGIGLYSGNLGAPFSGPNSGIRACSVTYSVH